jgi:MFS family permease
MAQSEIAQGLAGGARDAGASRMGRHIVFLLALAVFINYVDRGNLATAAPLIRGELKLSNYQIGILLSAFFWSYTPGQLVAGWIAEELGAAATLALGLAVWSLATTLSGFAGGFTVFLLLRLMLGVGESAAFPASSKLLAANLPTARLGAANGLISAGLALGPAFGTFVGGLVMARWGWRITFLVFGIVSLFWLVPWVAATTGARTRLEAPETKGAPSYLAILKRRELWGASLGQFSGNYAFYFFIYWLPLYLIRARGFSLSEMAVAGGIIYVIYALASQSAGVFSDVWIRAGASDNDVRKTFMVVAYVGTAASLLASAIGGPFVSLAALYVAPVFFGLSTPTLYCIGQTLAGPKASGKWMALQNGFANIAGIVGPIITGYAIDATKRFALAFAVAAGVALLGAFAWSLVIPKVAPLAWEPA